MQTINVAPAGQEGWLILASHLITYPGIEIRIYNKRLAPISFTGSAGDVCQQYPTVPCVRLTYISSGTNSVNYYSTGGSGYWENSNTYIVTANLRRVINDGGEYIFTGPTYSLSSQINFE